MTTRPGLKIFLPCDYLTDIGAARIGIGGVTLMLGLGPPRGRNSGMR